MFKHTKLRKLHIDRQSLCIAFSSRKTGLNSALSELKATILYRLLFATLAAITLNLSGIANAQQSSQGTSSVRVPTYQTHIWQKRSNDPVETESRFAELPSVLPSYAKPANTVAIDVIAGGKKERFIVPVSTRTAQDDLSTLALPQELLSDDATESLPLPSPREPNSPNDAEAVDAVPLDLVSPSNSNLGPTSNSGVDDALGNRYGDLPTVPQQTPTAPLSIEASNNPILAPIKETKKDKERFADLEFFKTYQQPPTTAVGTRLIPYQNFDFAPPPLNQPFDDPFTAASVYRGKVPIPTQRPLIELGRPLYTGGVYEPGRNWFGATNLVMPHFMVYGDFRTGAAVNRNSAGDANAVAFRLNLELDLELTATERIHAFIGPADRAGDFTRFDFTNDPEFVNRTDMRFDTLFFEGDAGAILGGLAGTDSAFDLPFSFGFLPLFYQNGVWANDNVIGAAVALPAKHSRRLKWSNFDASLFWASDQINSDAFPGDNNAAEFFGTAWFIEAYEGYIEANYAFVNDDVIGDRSYHNVSLAFSRRYFDRISNAVRVISNFGQDLPSAQQTADGHLLIIENSLISAAPNTFVPYCNFFYGQGRPQSLARAGIAGGVLNNIGINFENDGLTGYPTLDPTGNNTFGAALGLNIIGDSFSQQLILEAAALGAKGSQQFRNAQGDQYAFGIRYQKPLNNAWIFRTDHMYGWMRNDQDIHGSRVELRWKF